MPILNAFSVDLEGWYQSLLPDPAAIPLEKQRHGIEAGVEALLGVFRKRGVQATWFTLGAVAELMPDIVARIAAEGHEIASHGFGHEDVDALGPEGFRADLEKAHRILEKACGAAPAGYRSPKWSAGRAGMWMYEALAALGYRYDSSLNPVPPLGTPGMRRDCHRIRVANKNIVEFPPMTARAFGRWLPGGGSLGLRNLTQRVVFGRVAALNAAGEPAMFWVHPWELAPGKLSGRMPFLTRVAVNLRRVDLAARLDRLFAEFSFGTASGAIAAREERGALPEIDEPAWCPR